MAVSPPELYNNWWVYLRVMGSTHLNPTPEQIHNAYRFRKGLQQQGYDEVAIAGVIGNAQTESGITPGAIQKVSALPNGAESIADVPNSYMLQYYTPTAGGQGYGLGLLQWDRYSTLYQSHDLLGWENANGFNWYDGAGQLARLDFEFQNDSTYHFWHMNYGSRVTWDYFKNIGSNEPTWDAGESANIWASCWELSSTDPTGRQNRRDNALFWYQYFIDHPSEMTTTKLCMIYQNSKRRVGKKRWQTI